MSYIRPCYPIQSRHPLDGRWVGGSVGRMVGNQLFLRPTRSNICRVNGLAFFFSLLGSGPIWNNELGVFFALVLFNFSSAPLP